MSVDTNQGTRADWWPPAVDGELEAPVIAVLEVERAESDRGRVAIHTMVDGCGSRSSYSLDREAAIAHASAILEAVVLR